MSRAGRILLKAFSLLLIPLVLTGCWDEKEIDAISIIIGLGIDAADDDQILVTVQSGKTANQTSSDSSGASEESPTLVMQSTEKSVSAALESFRLKNSRLPYLHHNQVLIFGKEQAEKDINSYLDIFMRQHEMRMEVWILIAEGTAAEIISANIQPEQISGIALTRIMQNETNISRVLGVTLLDYLTVKMEQHTAQAVPMVRIQDVDGKQELMLSGMAVVKNGRMIGALTGDQVQGYAWIMGSEHERVIEGTSPEGDASLNLTQIQCTRTPSFKDGKPAFSLCIECKFSINELMGFDGMVMDEIVPILEDIAKKTIEDEVAQCYAAARQLNADIISVGNMFYESYPKEWAQIDENWEELFQTMEFSVDVEAEFMSTGKIIGAMNMEEKN
jgi:spore germination protein KC